MAFLGKITGLEQKRQVPRMQPSAAQRIAAAHARRSVREILLIFTCLCTAAFLSSLDGTIVTVALPTIVSQFGDFAYLSWVIAAYVLTSAAAQPLYGKLSDIYGRRATFVTAVLIFTLGTILSGAAQSLAWLIAARAVQGIGGGGIQSLTQIMVGDLVPAAERGRYTGVISGVYAVSSVVGPVVGGALTSDVSWRWIFFVNLPFIAVCLALTARYLRIEQVLVDHKLDLLGSALVIAATSCLVLAVTWGGNQYAWSSAVTIVLLCATVVLFALVVLVESRVAEPIINLDLFRIWNFSLACAISILTGVAMFATLTYLPVYFQIVQGLSPTEAGLQTLPMTAGMVVSSVGTGNLIAHTGAYRFWPAAGSMLVAVACGLLSLVTPTIAYGPLAAYMVLLGLGLGMILSPVMIIAQNSVPTARMAVATATATFARTLGSAIGVAVYGAVLNDHLKTVLPSNLQAYINEGGVVARAQLANDTAALNQFLTGYNGAISTVFAYSVVPIAISFVCGLLVRFVPLRTDMDEPAEQVHLAGVRVVQMTPK